MENELPVRPAKHLIVTGGGPIGFVNYGVVGVMATRGAYSYDVIQTYHGVSSGGILCAILNCGIAWSVLNDYVIKRPWEELFYVSPERLFATFSNNGVFGDDMIEDVMAPLLECIELTTDVSMKEFYDATGKTLVLYAYDLNSKEFELYEISHLTHPNMRLITAIRATCAIPVMLAPVSIQNSYLIDGGVVTNVPVNASIKFIKAFIGKEAFNEDDVWVIQKGASSSTPNITQPVNLLHGIVGVMRKLCHRMSKESEQKQVTNSLVVDTFDISRIETWMGLMDTATKRQVLISDGKKIADEWFNSKT